MTSWRTSKRLLVTALASLLSADAFAQQAAPDVQSHLVEQIAELRTTSGATTPELIGPLHVLGMLYQETQQHVLAIAALEEARYVTRVNLGLSSVDEALLLKQQIRSEDELGRKQRAWDLELDMLTIARKHLDDIRTVAIFRGLADDRSEVLGQVREGKYPQELYLGCYYSGTRPRYDDPRDELRPAEADDRCHFGKRDAVRLKLREEILMYYADAIEAILINGDYASQDLRALERQALRVGFSAPYLVNPSIGNATLGETLFVGVENRCSNVILDELLALPLLGSCLEAVVRKDGHVIANVGSWVSLVRLIAYETRSGASEADRANALVELADWHLLSAPADRRHLESSTDMALEIYQRAYRQLQRDADTRMSMFSPELPVTLPAYEPNPFTSNTTGASSRYIDVAFDITRHGIGERVEIRDTSSGATRAEERDLIRLIESTSFRPRVVDGALADSSRVAFRYDLSP
jgi:tetratricopeptide (TPR) repeat protein